MDDAEEYCRKNAINSFAFIKENSITSTSQIFTTNTNFNINQETANSVNDYTSPVSASNQSFVKIRSLIEKGYKFIEKKFNLHEFLLNANSLMVYLNSFSNVNSKFLPNSSPVIQSQNMLIASSSTSSLSNSFNSSSTLSNLNNSSFNQSSNNNNNNNTYCEFLNILLNSNMQSITPSVMNTPTSSNVSTIMTSSGNFASQLNVTFLLESHKQQSTSGPNRKKVESQIIGKLNHVFSLFSSRTRIELILIETTDNVLQILANGLHLEMEENFFNLNWAQCLDKLNNSKYKKQLYNYRLDEIIYEYRYIKKSKVFILYSLKSENFKLLVAP